MIIFYEKATGKIVGTIDGRIHSEDHLRMWMGDREKNDRIVVNWKVVGKEKAKVAGEEVNIWEPDHEQKELMAGIDNGNKNILDYKVGKDKKLVKSTRPKEKEKKEKKPKITKEQRLEETKEHVEVVADAKKPIEERFDSLVKILNIK